MKKHLLVMTAWAISISAVAKLPAPSDEAKAKAAAAAAKTAHGNKVNSYKLCLSQDKTVAHYFKTQGKAAPKSGAACVDPGAFKPVETSAPAAAGAKPATAPAQKG